MNQSKIKTNSNSRDENKTEHALKLKIKTLAIKNEMLESKNRELSEYLVTRPRIFSSQKDEMVELIEDQHQPFMLTLDKYRINMYPNIPVVSKGYERIESLTIIGERSWLFAPCKATSEKLTIIKNDCEM